MPTFFTSATPTTSSNLTLNGVSRPSFQLAVTGIGAVDAVAVVEGSHDMVGWIEIARLECAGSSYATDGGPVETNWPIMRGRLISVTGTATLHFSL